MGGGAAVGTELGCYLNISNSIQNHQKPLISRIGTCSSLKHNHYNANNADQTTVLPSSTVPGSTVPACIPALCRPPAGLTVTKDSIHFLGIPCGLKHSF